MNPFKSRRYNDYPTYIKEQFGQRVQKLSINAGFTCPNRDGSLGRGGCTYCNNQSFSPSYLIELPSIKEQLGKGRLFFSKKYVGQQYLAYFQAYTNTYSELEDLKKKYEEALQSPGVIGLVIGTRPDCVSDELLDYLTKLKENYYIAIEYGIESTHNSTLDKINRGHSFEDSIEAIKRTVAKGIPTGGHLILGLPGEDREMILSHAGRVSNLGLTFIKLHQLQLVKGTMMYREYRNKTQDFFLPSVEEYIDLAIAFIERLNPSIIIERFISQSPPDLLASPKWGIKNFEFVAMLEKELLRRDTWQGRLYNKK